jgi:hypothetical protein
MPNLLTHKVLEQNIMNNEKVGVVRLGYNHEFFSITSKSFLLILLTLVSLDTETFHINFIQTWDLNGRIVMKP